MDQLVSQGPMGWVKGVVIPSGMPGWPRGYVASWGICECPCACEPGESDVFAALLTFCLCLPKRRRGRVLCLVWVLNVEDAGATPCLYPVSSSCVCVSCSLCLFGICAQLHSCLNLKVGKQHLLPSAWHKVSRHWAGAQHMGPGLVLLKKAAANSGWISHLESESSRKIINTKARFQHVFLNYTLRVKD